MTLKKCSMNTYRDNILDATQCILAHTQNQYSRIYGLYLSALDTFDPYWDDAIWMVIHRGLQANATIFC